MFRDPSLRASDAEREAVAARLRESHAEGRLSLEELDERLDSAYAAKTYGDLDRLVADLPRGMDRQALLAHAGAHVLDGFEERRRTRYRRRLTRYISLNAILWGIWAVFLWMPGHHVEGPWPLFYTIPFGIMLLSRRRGMSLLGFHGMETSTGQDRLT